MNTESEKRINLLKDIAQDVITNRSSHFPEEDSKEKISTDLLRKLFVVVYKRFVLDEIHQEKILEEEHEDLMKRLQGLDTRENEITLRSDIFCRFVRHFSSLAKESTEEN